MPMGGYSIWGGLRPVNASSPIVMAVAGIDSTSFFHDQVCCHHCFFFFAL
jgi:hypothetical protein